MNRLAIVYSTTETRHDALVIGRAIVSERLAACANVTDGVTSVFRWDHEIQETAEVILTLKTRPELVAEVMRRVAELHRYGCPCILSWETADAAASFAQWVNDETSAEAADSEEDTPPID